MFLWSVIEAVIAEVLYSLLGHTILAIALKIALSVAIGFPLLYSIIKDYGTVEIDDDPDHHRI